MQSETILGLAAENEFFDWVAGTDARFFLAPEVAVAHGYPLRAPQQQNPYAPSGELPRSAS